MKRLNASLYSYALQIIRVVFSIQVKVNPASICIQYQSLFGFYLTSRLKPNQAQSYFNQASIKFKTSIEVKVYPVSIPNLISGFRFPAALNVHKCNNIIADNNAKSYRTDEFSGHRKTSLTGSINVNLL